MKRNLNKTLLSSAVILFCILSFGQSNATGMCSACGDYVTIGDKTVFFCGNNGNTNCLKPCPAQ